MDQFFSPQNIELFNQKRVISKLLASRDPMSRAALAKSVGLSRTTLSTIISRLMDLELVEELDNYMQDGERGRPGIPVRLRTDVWYAAGATLIDNDMLFVLLGIDEKVACSFTLPLTELTPEAFLETLCEGFRQLKALCPGKLLPTVGIGSPGIVVDNEILTAADYGWENVPIDTFLSKRGFPTEVINRHWASCIAEQHSVPDCKNMIYIGVSTGIASAIIVDGKLFTGAYHSAGEIGHTVVNPDGPFCTCGRRGCLQAVSSEIALIKNVTNYYRMNPSPVIPDDSLWAVLASGHEITIPDIISAAESRNPVAEKHLSDAAKYLGLSASNLVAMFNPQRVILGGSLLDSAGDSFYSDIVENIKRYSRPFTSEHVEFRPWSLGRYSGAIGAAMLVLDKKIELAASSLNI